jgi:hypothetical protein
MKSIPRLVGEIIPETTGSRSNKEFLIVKNPSNLENDRPIEMLNPEALFSWMGFVIVKTVSPATSDKTDASGNTYPIGAIWINTSTSPHLVYILTAINGNNANWIKLSDQVVELSINNWNDIPGILDSYFITTTQGVSQNAPKDIDSIWLVKLSSNATRTMRVMQATNMKDPGEVYTRTFLNNTWSSWSLPFAIHY